MATIASGTYGVGGVPMRRFWDGVLEMPVDFGRYCNVILPGIGTSKAVLRPYGMNTVMDLVSDEVTSEEASPTLGNTTNLVSPERALTLPWTKTMSEDSSADRDGMLSGLLYQLGQAGGVTMSYLLDRWFADYAFGNETTGLGVSGGDGVAFFSDSHTSPTNDNLLSGQNFGAEGFSNALIQLGKQKSLSGRRIRYSKDLVIVFGPSLLPRFLEFVGSAGRPFEASNTYNIANDFTITGYMDMELNSDNEIGGVSSEYFWAVFDRVAMTSPNGSGLNMKIMRLPNLVPGQSENGLKKKLTNSVRVGIGAGTTTFGVGCTGTA